MNLILKNFKGDFLHFLCKLFSFQMIYNNNLSFEKLTGFVVMIKMKRLIEVVFKNCAQYIVWSHTIKKQVEI